MVEFPVTPQTRVRRIPGRAHYDKETVYGILDDGLICHVGFVQDEQPFVIPTLFARMGDALVLHGAPGSRLLQHVGAGNAVCVTVTLTDGLVLARSVFHHSVNYRSVVLLGRGRLVSDEAEKLRALEAITEHIIPGRWAEARAPNAQELAATAVAVISIESASAKIRTGPPADDEADYTLPIWAGVLPLRVEAQPSIDDPQLHAGIPVAASVRRYKPQSG